MTKPFITLATVCVLALSFFALRSYNAHKAAERELAKAKAVEQEIKALEKSMEQAPEIPADLEEQIKKLENENRELHRLRNEVRQLRQQTNSLAQLRETNRQLLAGIKGSEEKGTLDPSALGFVPANQWRDAGMSSPKNTLITLFHYLSKGDIQTIVKLSNLADTEDNPLERLSGTDLERAAESMKEFSQAIQAFRVAELEERSDTEVTAQVQTALDGEAVPIRLFKTGNDWRLDARNTNFF